MAIHVHQSINIQTIKIGSIANSSVLQIGTAGVITPSSNLYNTGGFKKAAPLLLNDNLSSEETLATPSLVPLT